MGSCLSHHPSHFTLHTSAPLRFPQVAVDNIQLAAGEHMGAFPVVGRAQVGHQRLVVVHPAIQAVQRAAHTQLGRIKHSKIRFRHSRSIFFTLQRYKKILKYARKRYTKNARKCTRMPGVRQGSSKLTTADRQCRTFAPGNRTQCRLRDATQDCQNNGVETAKQRRRNSKTTALFPVTKIPDKRRSPHSYESWGQKTQFKTIQL